MHETHLQQVDLNLLHILQALLEERHVTRAANRCFLSQSAMSRAFERLREMFKDDLLIRRGRTYERTVRGERLLRDLENLLPRIAAMIRGEAFENRKEPGKNPSRTNRQCQHGAATCSCSSDADARAEHDQLEVVAWNDRVYHDIESGRIDRRSHPNSCPCVRHGVSHFGQIDRSTPLSR
jgi:DNA-binding transcriptional LysR family regulator